MVQAVILDWAGTTVDYGSFAPVKAFMDTFAEEGVEVTAEEVRKPMGRLKIDHLRAICALDRVAARWREVHGAEPGEADVQRMYAAFEERLLGILPQYAEPVPGAVALAERLRERGIRIGSTTGYTAEMMDIVAPEAQKRGYAPDVLVTPSEVAAGRPAPWMIYRNAEKLGVQEMHGMVKCGDTFSDIEEGRRAGVWTAAVLLGSSELGLTQPEVLAEDPAALAGRMERLAEAYREAGAHYVIDTIGDLDAVVTDISARLARGERP
ncbi:phosphonoacetaldehyde hydrolase [Paenibacillus mucilaginosus]|uniref:Phosphonoacetaldehyde hydrolase n=3 Tax=Paenibacillus mucilaginosus TaxID=61624 RepID=H6N8Y6_9BACL|nr:phosphonoacetaldehyde hydrolase [Paenibacillus mucilaginosus]AEI39473.1 phosphonoacetaldehyde hydrolase [Paenibacillus mucilaginosus KNP414]AFC27732.1 phosphonoacetaldehyde hydrolase [Paenibacillus mucilaginosus 3016]AFH59887.1 phosphonoacetaldehyde hydrolase [Paenibacillus mucilaginosus K02]MCG7214698.1 phosphonoacetaldehyde hydrolase [Paenibacillus mucilaginosus]WDM28442.1 phosphonoacetaldehyde hydrolase [Paenibacillus mucilaginosus]